MCLAIEGFSDFNDLLPIETILAHFFDSHQLVAKQGVFGLIDRSHPSPTQLLHNTITFFEQVGWDQQTGGAAADGDRGCYRNLERVATGKTECCLCLVGCATVGAVERERRNHAPAPLSAFRLSSKMEMTESNLYT